MYLVLIKESEFSNLFSLLPEFSFTNIHDSQNSRVRGRLFLYLFYFYPLHNTYTLVGQLLQNAHLCT